MILRLSEYFPWVTIIVVLIVLIGVFLIVKYIYIPFQITFYTSLSLAERLEVLEKENCLYKKHYHLASQALDKSPFKKSNSFDTLFLMERQEFIEAIDISSGEACYFWMRIRRSFLFHVFTDKQIMLHRETNPKIISLYKSELESDTILVNDKCPACGFEVKMEDTKCSDCGLVFT